MRLLTNFSICALGLLTGCAQMPNFLQTVEDIENDDAIRIVLYKEALQKGCNLRIQVDVDNSSASK
jgi:hypothetical protein